MVENSGKNKYKKQQYSLPLIQQSGIQLPLQTASKLPMTRKSGTADLPLHGGHVPPWLADRMTKLGAVITQAIVYHYGRDEMLRRLAHPFWFQSFGAVMGMDWHSSGITTSVMGALKRGLTPMQDELGIYVCGGRGKYSRQTPNELLVVGNKTGIDGDALGYASRMVAKVDSAAVQDGFQLYLHGFVVTKEGRWTVIQQGMNDAKGQARRYHWLSEDLKDFVDSPHTAIDGLNQGDIINLTDSRASNSRVAQLELLTTLGPDRIAQELIKIEAKPIQYPVQTVLHLDMPDHHEVRPENISAKRLYGNLAAAADRGPVDFKELLMTPGVGERTVKALALVAEVLHGAPCRFNDPARFSLAHGGKDRHPYPVPIKVYDETINVLKSAVQNAKLGREEELAALKRLDAQSRKLEQDVSDSFTSEMMKDELNKSRQYGGRSVFGWE